MTSQYQTTLSDTVDYIILKMNEAGGGLSLLKLQKLLYYVQAWHLAFYDRPMFNGKFQAWVHGPVNRETFNRFRETHNLYSEVVVADMKGSFSAENLSAEAVRHINTVLDSYAKFAGFQLEELTHGEQPWILAREGFAPVQRCEAEIDENLMASYYRSRMS